MKLSVATPAEVEAIRGLDPAFHHEMGVVVVSLDDKPAQRVVQLGPYYPRCPAGFNINHVCVALSDIAEEASEVSGTRHEGEAVLEDGAIRIRFGRWPRGSRDVPWREVVPELEPVPLNRVSG